VAPGSLTCEISRRPRWRTFYLGLGISAAVVLLVIVVQCSEYGLDGVALAVAKQIQFRPALRDGRPYDYAAHPDLRFELAD
jgi:hypothetical protein